MSNNPNITGPESLQSLANGLSIFRIAMSPGIANDFMTTPPEDRTAGMAVKTAVVGATDFVDGYLARQAGTSELGAWLDQVADKLFVAPSQMALSRTGEMSAVHPSIKIARDLSVNALRLYARHQGNEVPAGKLGKQKTTIEMATLTLANSPLATDPNLIRRGASISTALSLFSGVEYFMDYFKKSESEEVDTARNSKTREVFSGPVDTLATFLDEKTPWLKPDHLTLLGAGLVVSSGILARKNPDKASLPTLLYTVGSLIDGLDGSLARKKAQKHGETTTTSGMLKDLWADKVQEVFTLTMLSLIARERGNDVAADNYAAGAMTTCLSALSRAVAESRGLIVNEGGIGTRVGRGVLGGIGMALNKNQDVSDIVSGGIASGNTITTTERTNVAIRGESSSYTVGVDTSENFKQDGRQKVKSLVALAAGGIVAGSVAFAYKRNK